MDEPLSALDALLREEMQNMLKRCWREEGYAQVLVTHSIEEAVFLGHWSRRDDAAPRQGGEGGRQRRVLADDWRDTPLFFERCRLLRDVLRSESPSGRAVEGEARRSAP